MKALVLSLITFLAFASSLADARAASIDNWECRMKGNISGLKLGFGIGGQFLSGDGAVYCSQSDNPNLVVKQPISITILGGGITFFDITYVKAVKVVTAGIGRVSGPESLMGEYKISASAGGTLINRGLNVDIALAANSDSGFGFEVGLQGEKAYGLGLRLYGLLLLIEKNGSASYISQ